jgi:6-phosphogluconate dehydrogenase
MLQAIGEGMDLLERYREPLPTADILSCWGHGSVIRSWLVELMEKLYRQEGGLSKVPAYVEDTGEVNWLVEDAIRMEVPIPVITQSVVQLLASRDQKHNWARAIAMMRHGFGGHPYGTDAVIVRERQTGRVGGSLARRRPTNPDDAQRKRTWTQARADAACCGCVVVDYVHSVPIDACRQGFIVI